MNATTTKKNTFKTAAGIIQGARAGVRLTSKGAFCQRNTSKYGNFTDFYPKRAHFQKILKGQGPKTLLPFPKTLVPFLEPDSSKDSFTLFRA